MNENEAKTQLILKGYGGSIAYGTNTPSSDVDLRGVFIPPKEYWVGLKSVDQINFSAEDTTFYSLQKFFMLAIKANPNILELLWLRDNHYIWKDVPKDFRSLGRKLISNRNLFLSKNIKHTYTGYAYSQLHRMDKLNKNVAQNADRTARVEKFGYDTKNAMHLIRLLRTGLEILTEGELHVFREDARDLLAIKDGKYTYDELVEKAQRYDELIEEAYVRSPLPHKPDFNAIQNLHMEMVEEALSILNKR